MNNNTENIDNLVKDKFESFTPTPPDYIWGEIEKGIVSSSKPFWARNRTLISAAILILLGLLTTFFAFNPFSDTNETNNVSEQINGIEKPAKPTSTFVDEATNSKKDVVGDIINQESEKVVEKSREVDFTEPVNDINQKGPIQQETKAANVNLGNITVTENKFVNTPLISNSQKSFMLEYRKEPFTIAQNDISFMPFERNNVYEIPDDISEEIKSKPKNSRWEIGYFISPELTESAIDSVEILNSFNFNIEPTYFINNNWYIRSGLGFSYVRDRGFAKIKYNTQEYMGSYDDVYDITFDTLHGNITPVYHTKKVEVWDSVRHISVSNVTNSYLYLQIPLIFGYSSKSSGSPLSWYVNAGPAFNIKVSEWIETPKLSEPDADIISLQNNLPTRASNYFQLWVGAGLEYKLNKKLSVAIEPGYRHYLNNVYNNKNNQGPSNGFTLRVGLVYLMK